jgi:hypothetical protein
MIPQCNRMLKYNNMGKRRLEIMRDFEDYN